MKGCENGFGAFAASRIVFRQYSRRFRTPLLSYSKLFAGVTINYGFGLRLLRAIRKRVRLLISKSSHLYQNLTEMSG